MEQEGQMSDTCLGCGKKLYKKDHYYADGYCEDCHVSKKKGPFDAAIELLREKLAALKTVTFFPQDVIEPTEKSIEAAIRVLEAAGKVDKATLISHLSRLEKDAGAISPGIRALIESLPEREKEGI
jgi:hypothetical protein